MKQNAFLIILCLITSILSAQTLTSDGFIISISNIKSETGTTNMAGTTYNYNEYTGNYTIEKDGVLIAKQSFSSLQLNNGAVNVNIKNKAGYSNTVTYDYDSKRMEYRYEKYKIKKPKNTYDIILNAILIYAKTD